MESLAISMEVKLLCNSLYIASNFGTSSICFGQMFEIFVGNENQIAELKSESTEELTFKYMSMAR